jgi:hypothetical protein
MVVSEPFVQVPRRLARLLEGRELTTNEWAMATYLLAAGADRGEGVLVTRDHLEDVLSVSRSTVQRATAKLRDLGLFVFDVHERQRTPFRARIGPTAFVTTTPADPPRAVERQ